MRLGPIHALNFRFSNDLVVFSLHFHGYGQPLQPLRDLDLVAVAPVSPGILHIVVKVNQFVPLDVWGKDAGHLKEGNDGKKQEEKFPTTQAQEALLSKKISYRGI